MFHKKEGQDGAAKPLAYSQWSFKREKKISGVIGDERVTSQYAGVLSDLYAACEMLVVRSTLKRERKGIREK